MTIKRIKILNLFNTFNHEIRFNKNITIVMGENGVGKTIALRLIEAIFSRRMEYLIEKDFSEIIITFHKETWHITRKLDSSPKDPGYPEYVIQVRSTRKGTSPFFVTSGMLMPRIPSFYVRDGENSWYNRRIEAHFTREALFERFGSDVPAIEFPFWYNHQCEQNRVNLIKTQRLFQDNEKNGQFTTLSVEKYSKELSALMQEEISKVAKSTGDLDRTFPKRLLGQMRSNHKYSASEILGELHKLERHRHELSDLGLLTETEVNTLFEKLSLLKEIINSHFKHKTFTVDSFKGFVVVPERGDSRKSSLDEEIRVELLSSGEQNELVLFYELLFKCDDRDLILIDEPEISLHLDWLQKMIGDLQRITDVNKASLLIATHSPDFVGDNYELVQNEDATEMGIGVKKYGSLVIPLPLDALSGSTLDLDMKVHMNMLV